jgi:hypothetical protein
MPARSLGAARACLAGKGEGRAASIKLKYDIIGYYLNI